MTFKTGLKQYKMDRCILYGVNEIKNVIFIVYIDDMLKIGDKLSVNSIESHCVSTAVLA